jgi:hypothetical protein
MGNEGREREKKKWRAKGVIGMKDHRDKEGHISGGKVEKSSTGSVSPIHIYIYIYIYMYIYIYIYIFIHTQIYV